MDKILKIKIHALNNNGGNFFWTFKYYQKNRDNSDKIKAIMNLKEPSTLDDVQVLSGLVVDLNRFISV